MDKCLGLPRPAIIVIVLPPLVATVAFLAASTSSASSFFLFKKKQDSFISLKMAQYLNVIQRKKASKSKVLAKKNKYIALSLL